MFTTKGVGSRMTLLPECPSATIFSIFDENAKVNLRDIALLGANAVEHKESAYFSKQGGGIQRVKIGYS